ncbi:peptidoglycan DD-metalloendopeptidase family protein [Flexithrix dorotheae]|uniref:peptidoglycan DD-metalloendopeptidase family protein n=1 Tax=Flexithrix dorotheae TaxID=70993 RepID=UPI0009FDE99B|nr:peptidoglycan DD-metalloendopeptidase family protein [Flexithrix dorotheae]
MNGFLLYALSSACCLIVFYLFYRWILQSAGLPQWNRFFLLIALGLSFLIPVLEIDSTAFSKVFSASISESGEMVEAVENQFVYLMWEKAAPSKNLPVAESSGSADYYYFWIGLAVYLIGYVISFLSLKRNIFSILKIALNGKVTRKGSYYLIEIKHKPYAFSFFKMIFLNPEGLKEEEKSQIIAHEKVHVLEWHSLDILLVEMLRVVFWFNPILGLYKKAIEQNHEYIADQQTAQKYGVSNYFKLVLKMAIRQQKGVLANHFANIPIKTRIQKINQNPIQPMQKFKYFIAVPLIGGLLACFSCEEEIQELKPKEKEIAVLQLPEVLVEDSPHIPKKAIPDIFPLSDEGFKKVRSGFGMRFHPILKVKRMHTGVDFTAPEGTPVIATANGKVAQTEVSKKGYGNSIELEHDEEISSFYSHLSEILVEEGQEVKKGDVIGTVGSTGLSVKPHLHYEIKKGDKKVDPKDFFGSQVEVLENQY